jgi:hypothetical protein
MSENTAAAMIDEAMNLLEAAAADATALIADAKAAQETELRERLGEALLVVTRMPARDIVTQLGEPEDEVTDWSAFRQGMRYAARLLADPDFEA